MEKKGAWSEEEDRILLDVIQEYEEEGQPLRWCQIAKRVSRRSAKQCRERYVYNLDPNITKAPWTKEEDALLIYAQKELGNSWAKISQHLPGRTENSTKTRFKSIVRAQRRAWKKEEDETLLRLNAVLGSRWEEIAKSLPGRTTNAVKTRYRILSGEIPEFQPGSPNQALGYLKTDFAKVQAAYAKASASLSNLVKRDSYSLVDELDFPETPKNIVPKRPLEQPNTSPVENKRLKTYASFDLNKTFDDDYLSERRSSIIQAAEIFNFETLFPLNTTTTTAATITTTNNATAVNTINNPVAVSDDLLLAELFAL